MHISFCNEQRTILFQWDLVCDKNYLSDLTQVIYQLGGMVGDIVGAPITDYFGRKWVHASSYIIVAVFGVGLGFSQNYTTFIIIRFFISIAVSVSVRLSHWGRLLLSYCICDKAVMLSHFLCGVIPNVKRRLAAAGQFS